MSFIIFIVAFISAAIWPGMLSFSVFEVVMPLSIVLPPVSPDSPPDPVNHVVVPVSSVLAFVGPDISAVALLFAFMIASLILAAGSPDFGAVAMLQVVPPCALEPAPFPDQNPSATGHIVGEVALVGIPIGESELALAAGPAIHPVALV